MRINLITMIAVVLILGVSLSVKAEDPGWSFKPFEVKESYTRGSESVYTANWGAELDTPCGLFEFTGKSNFSNVGSQLAMEYSKELGAWFYNLWGMIDSTETSTLHDHGLKIRWDCEQLFGGASLKSLQRASGDSDYRYGYKGWEGVTDWGWLSKNGTRFKMVLDRKMLDYDYRIKDSSDKIHLESSLRGKLGDSQWSLVWKEWSYDYPNDPMDNLWGTQGELSWSHRFERQYMRVKLTGVRRELGDGVVQEQGKIEWGETYYFKRDTLTLKCYLAREDGSSWIEDVYQLSQDQEEDWGIGTRPGWGTNLSYRREIGLHRLWKFGCFYHDDDGVGSWGVHTEWDIYIWGNWRLRFNLNESDSDDQERSAGAWIKATYYF